MQGCGVSTPSAAEVAAKRRALAEAQGLAAYMVFTDKTLIEMAEKKPANLDQMAGITGVGARKLESYGTAFLEVITGAAEGLHPARMRLVGRPEGAVFDRLVFPRLSAIAETAWSPASTKSWDRFSALCGLMPNPSAYLSA